LLPAGVGHFFSPLHTFLDSSFLGTLPLAEIRSGVGEIMKAALVHDVRLWDIMQVRKNNKNNGGGWEKREFYSSLYSPTKQMAGQHVILLLHARP
jgi:3-dehydroquinate synthetase